MVIPKYLADAKGWTDSLVNMYESESKSKQSRTFEEIFKTTVLHALITKLLATIHWETFSSSELAIACI